MIAIKDFALGMLFGCVIVFLYGFFKAWWDYITKGQ